MPSVLQQAIREFQLLNITSPDIGDSFFQKFGLGNTTFVIDSPFERFDYYESLLEQLQKEDKIKYEQIHKGTPFYFLGWTAFDLGNYEKAVFYMDAAISEDIRKDPVSWLDNPAPQFLLLNSGGGAAIRITNILKEKVEKELSIFNSKFLCKISINDFVEKFVKVLLINKKENRSIITALYSFILEYEDRENELKLRSVEGGSMESILTFLFKGGLIFESLLKFLYPSCKNGTLNDVFKLRDFKNDFSLTSVKTSAVAIKDIISSISMDDQQTAFNTINKIRNTSGHNLVWDDAFKDPNQFKKIYNQQINAIFLLIQNKFLINRK